MHTYSISLFFSVSSFVAPLPSLVNGDVEQVDFIDSSLTEEDEESCKPDTPSPPRSSHAQARGCINHSCVVFLFCFFSSEAIFLFKHVKYLLSYLLHVSRSLFIITLARISVLFVPFALLLCVFQVKTESRSTPSQSPDSVGSR